jgi:hypothetical protein
LDSAVLAIRRAVDEPVGPSLATPRWTYHGIGWRLQAR